MFYVAGAAVAAGGGYLAAKESAKGQEEAAETRAEAARSAEQMQWDMYEQTREDYAPYRELGEVAAPQLQYLATGRPPMVTDEDTGVTSADPDFVPMDVTTSPLYQFKQREGEEAINRALAARGRYDSSTAVNQLAELTHRLTAEESERQYGRMLDLANVGRGASAGVGRAGMMAGQTAGQYAMAGGQALAGGQAGASRQKASMYSNLGALPMQAYNAYQQSQAYGNNPVYTPESGGEPGGGYGRGGLFGGGGGGTSGVSSSDLNIDFDNPFGSFPYY